MCVHMILLVVERDNSVIRPPVPAAAKQLRALPFSSPGALCACVRALPRVPLHTARPVTHQSNRPLHRPCRAIPFCFASSSSSCRAFSSLAFRAASPSITIATTKKRSKTIKTEKSEESNRKKNGRKKVKKNKNSHFLLLSRLVLSPKKKQTFKINRQKIKQKTKRISISNIHKRK